MSEEQVNQTTETRNDRIDPIPERIDILQKALTSLSSRLNRNTDQILEKVESLQKEVATMQKLLEGGKPSERTADGSIERAIDEYRRLPEDSNNMIRWGFIGAWGPGGRNGAAHAACSISTTSIDAFMATNNKAIAEFAKVYTNPNTIAICKYLFQNEENASREAIKTGCFLDDAELDEAVEPMLEWNLVAWEDGRLKKVGHGVNLALTLCRIAGTAIGENRSRHGKQPIMWK